MKYKKTSRKKILIETLTVIVLSLGVFIVSANYDLLESLFNFTRKYEYIELDEIIPVSLFLVIVLIFYLFRKISDLLTVQNDLIVSNDQLKKALAEIKQLQGIIPICSCCKNIRDDKGYWQKVETYIQTHSEAQFSHSICPGCFEKEYPEYAKDPKVAEEIKTGQS